MKLPRSVEAGRAALQLRRGAIAVGLAMLVGSVPLALAVVQDWYVDVNAPLCPGGIGTQALPFCDIMDAVTAAADGDTIHVAPGTYFENVVIDKGLAVIGAGGQDVTIVDGQTSGSVVHVIGSPVVTLTGLTLTNGTGTPVVPGATVGGGLNVESGLAALTLRNCTVAGNSATVGGGLRVYSYGLVLEGCKVTENVASLSCGGIICEDLTLRDSTISANTASGLGFPNDGWQVVGGVYSTYLTMTNSTVTENSASAPYFSHRVAATGGVRSNVVTTITNSVLAGNRAHADDGDAIGGICVADLVMTNTVVFDNDASTLAGTGEVDGILMSRWCGCLTRGCCPAPTHFVSHSLVQGGWPGVGNIATAPLFVDPLNGDYRLMPGSPCIDAGDNLAVPAGVWTDQGGKFRFIDDPLTPDTGQPGHLWPIVDMGAHEFGVEPPRKVRRR